MHSSHSGASQPETLITEELLAEYYAADRAILMASGSAALVCAMVALGVDPGDHVAVPVNAWIACAAAVKLIGAIPVFIDVDIETHCLSALHLRSVAERIDLKAVIVVHQNGMIADLTGIDSICRLFGIFFIEDCSHAHGAVSRGGKVGSSGHLSVFSTQQSKLISSGEGGFVLSQDPALGELVSRTRASGRLFEKRDYGFEVDEVFASIGHNFICNEFSASLIRTGMIKLDEQNERRKEAATYLTKALSPMGWTAVASSEAGRVFHKFVLQAPAEIIAKTSSLDLASVLTQQLGFRWSTLHPPITLNVLAGCFHDQNTDYPNAREAWQNCICFRHQFLLSAEKQLESIVDVLRKLAE